MRIKKITWVTAIVLCVGVILFSAVRIIYPLKNYREANSEYTALRQNRIRGATKTIDERGRLSQPWTPEARGNNRTSNEGSSSFSLSVINPDYVGWLQIPNTRVDYPIVRGQDNEKYLDTTFAGDKNPSGTIFMDYDLSSAFDAEHVILYGHNMQDGSMFGELHRYLDVEYLAHNPTIFVITAQDKTLAYTVFSARKTSFRDPAYRLDFPSAEAFTEFASDIGAPEGTEYLLTLSTCTSGGSRDERVVVHAGRRERSAGLHGASTEQGAR